MPHDDDVKEKIKFYVEECPKLTQTSEICETS